MVATPTAPVKPSPLKITWDPLPADYPLEEKPVENTGQPLLAGALRESLELSGWIQPGMLIASNFGLCATVNGDLVIKAPDWVYVSQVQPITGDRRSYTPNLEGAVPTLVMEFLSATEGDEYSVKRTFPPGKWFFYEQILQIPTYIIFDAELGLLEVYRLQGDRYQLEQPDENGRHWMNEMNLYFGTWRGTKEDRTGYWLRWWDADGNVLPWALEQIEQERQQAEQERQRAEQERQRAEQESQRAEQERQRAEQASQRAEQTSQRADRLAALLRAQGIDPEAMA
jgi:Putative restriction endonuclease